MTDNFKEAAEKELERLIKNREQLTKQLEETQQVLESNEAEIESLELYLHGKPAKAKRQSNGRAPRGTGKRADILSAIKDKPMNRADLLDHFKVKGDKSGEQSVSNALSALTKSKLLKRTKDGLYEAV